MKTHEDWIQRCLELAAKGCGPVGSGAMVGSVLVREGLEIASGLYAGLGQFHAERTLLQEFSGEIAPTDTLYVNLEPCVPSPTKRTPACVDILLERRVQRVVFGMIDPDNRVAGRGVSALKGAGVSVEGPVLETECKAFNRGFVSLRLRGRPWVGVVSEEDLVAGASSAWLVGAERQPFCALAVSAEELACSAALNKHIKVPSGPSEAKFPLIIVIDLESEDIGECPSGVIQLLDRRSVLRIGKRQLGFFGGGGNRSLETLEEIASDVRSALMNLGSPRGEFNGVSTLLLLEGGALHAAFEQAGLIDQVLR